MEIKITLWSFLLLFGCLQSILLLGVLNSKREHRHRRNKVLSLLLFVFLIISFDHSLRLSDLYKRLPSYIYTSDGLWYFIAPTLYFTAKFYVQPNYRFKWVDTLHLLPFIIMQLFYFDLLVQDGSEKMRILEAYMRVGSYSRLTSITICIMMIQILIYIFISLRILKSYQKEYKNTFSKNQLVQLNMFTYMFYFFFIYFLLEFIFSTFRNFSSYENTMLDNWSLVVWTIFIYGIGYISILNPTLILPVIPFVPQTNKNSPTVDDQLELSRVRKFLFTERLFINPDISLPELANHVGMSTNRLSYLINQVHGTNFYHFINAYRVAEVHKMIENGYYKKMSVMGISQEAGFRSKASFYKFFKQEYAITPTQLIKQIEAV